MKSYALFLGCYIPAMQPFAEVSLRKAAPLLSIKLLDIQGAACCPVPEIVRLADYDAWIYIAARNLSLAESVGRDLLVLCNGCWESLHESRETLLDNSDLRDEVNSRLSLLGREFTGKVKVRHFVEVMAEDVGVDKLRKAVKHPLANLNIAIQYGCKFYKSENEKFVTYFDDIVGALGAKVVRYGAERVCCGYPLRFHSLEASLEERSKWKLDSIKEAEPDCIVTVCPGCYDVLEKAQLLLKRRKLRYDIPMLHLTELIALALGFPPRDVGLDRHRIPCDAVVKKLGLRG